MTETFTFKHISTSLVRTTDEVLMNAARYEARVIKSRAISTSAVSPMMDSMVRFSLIMAHVSDTKGFPFAVPDPFAHPETVGLAWDAYMTEDAALWNQLVTAIEMSDVMTKQVKDNLPEAIAEMDVISAHNISPFKRKQNNPQKNRTNKR